MSSEKFNINDYSRYVASLGREIDIEAFGKARDYVTPYLEVAPFEDVTIHRDLYYGPDERHRMDVFTSSESVDTSRPLLVYLHGGGFIGGDKHVPDTPFFDNVGVWAVRNGYNAATMTYRLAPDNQWPSGVEDIQQALGYLKGFGEALGVSTARVFLTGHSAGACHVASYLSEAEKAGYEGYAELAGVILLSGIYDLTLFPATNKEVAYYGQEQIREGQSSYREYSTIDALVTTDCPVLAVIAEHEPAVFQQQTLTYLERFFARHQILPHHVYLKGHNHLTGILTLGLDGDILGPQIKHFIAGSVSVD